MTKTQLLAFLDVLVGEKELGVNSDGDTVEAPKSPEVRAFLEGYMAEGIPWYSVYGLQRRPETSVAWIKFFEEVATALREHFSKPETP
jgi:hypothetical protein